MSWLSRQYSWRHEALLLHETQQTVRQALTASGGISHAAQGLLP